MSILRLPSASRGELIARRAELCAQITQLHELLGKIRGDEVMTKANAYMNSREVALGGRNRDADFAARSIVKEIAEYEGTLRAAEEERDFIRELLSEVLVDG